MLVVKLFQLELLFISFINSYLYVVRLPTDKNPEVFEKYLASVLDPASDACGATISSPCNGVKATLDAVPET